MGTFQAVKTARQGGFTGAVWPNQGEALTRDDIKVDMAQRWDVAGVGKTEVANADHKIREPWGRIHQKGGAVKAIARLVV